MKNLFLLYFFQCGNGGGKDLLQKKGFLLGERIHHASGPDDLDLRNKLHSPDGYSKGNQLLFRGFLPLGGGNGTDMDGVHLH